MRPKWKFTIRNSLVSLRLTNDPFNHFSNITSTMLVKGALHRANLQTSWHLMSDVLRWPTGGLSADIEIPKTRHKGFGSSNLMISFKDCSPPSKQTYPPEKTKKNRCCVLWWMPDIKIMRSYFEYITYHRGANRTQYKVTEMLANYSRHWLYGCCVSIELLDYSITIIWCNPH